MSRRGIMEFALPFGRTEVYMSISVYSWYQAALRAVYQQPILPRDVLWPGMVCSHGCPVLLNLTLQHLGDA
jgi:hypothetical protein